MDEIKMMVGIVNESSDLDLLRKAMVFAFIKGLKAGKDVPKEE